MLFQSLCNEIILDEIKENTSFFKRTIEFNEIKKVEKELFKEFFENFSNNDTITIKFNSKFANINTLVDLKELDEFIDELNRDIKMNKDNDPYKLEVEIIKNNKDTFNIFNMEAFLKTFLEFTLKAQLEFFNKLIKNSKMKIYSPEIISTQTESFLFINDNDKKKKYNLNNNNRIFILEKAEFNIYSRNDYIVIPSDFKLLKSTGDSNFDNLLGRLVAISSLMYIGNTSYFADDKFISKILGYKQLVLTLDEKFDNKEISDILYKIYQWSYETGNSSSISDKLGLARNILSLGINQNLDLMNKNIITSITGAYELYLKENIKEYFTIKSSVTENLLGLSKDVDDISKKIKKDILNNIFAFLSVYLASFIGNVIIGGKSNELFSKDTFNLVLILIVLSSIYISYSITAIKTSFKNIEKLYRRLKESYRDILDSNDIKTIFNDDKYHEEDIKDAKKDVKNALILWGVILFIILVLSYFFTYGLVLPFGLKLQ